MTRLSDRQLAMVCGSEPSDLDPRSGCGVELRTGADYAVAKALQGKGYGSYEQGQWGLPGLYFNNDDGLQLRAETLGLEAEEEDDDEACR